MKLYLLILLLFNQFVILANVFFSISRGVFIADEYGITDFNDPYAPLALLFSAISIVVIIVIFYIKDKK